MQVKIVLRHRANGGYYRNHEEWVANPYDALTFRNILEAKDFCRAHSLQHLQLIQQTGYFPRPLRYAPPKVKAADPVSAAVATAN